MAAAALDAGRAARRGLVLLLALRSPARALVPLVPVVLASGWSALVAFGTGIPLNPMSAMLGALVIALCTEFSVLLSERYGRSRRRPLAGGCARARYRRPEPRCSRRD